LVQGKTVTATAELSVGKDGAWTKADGWIGYQGAWVPISAGGGAPAMKQLPVTIDVAGSFSVFCHTRGLFPQYGGSGQLTVVGAVGDSFTWVLDGGQSWAELRRNGTAVVRMTPTSTGGLTFTNVNAAVVTAAVILNQIAVYATGQAHLATLTDAAVLTDRAAQLDPGDEANGLLIAAAQVTDAATEDLAPMATDLTVTTVVYAVRRIVDPAWGPTIEAEVLRGYSVVGQLALRTFDPWDGAIPFAEVDGRLIATVVGVAQSEPTEWVYGIWVEGIALDEQTIPADVDEQTWLATRLIVDGVPVGGGSVPA
jgi:hypothetical protein